MMHLQNLISLFFQTYPKQSMILKYLKRNAGQDKMIIEVLNEKRYFLIMYMKFLNPNLINT